MTTRHALPSEPPRHLPDITLVPAVASLPTPDPSERRNLAMRKALLRRIRSEFEEMPGLTLTLAQGGRLFGVSADACSRIFGQLSAEGLLQPSRHGSYARRIGRP
jgi:hypothetical protein